MILVMPSSVFGPNDLTDANRVLHWCRKFKQRKALHWLPEDGKLVLNVAYGDDVAYGIHLAMRRGTAGEGGYLLGGTNISIRELMTRMAVLAGDGTAFRSFPVGPLMPLAALWEGVARLTRTRPLFDRGLVRAMRTPWAFSSAKAVEQLGYAITPFEAALKNTFESA